MQETQTQSTLKLYRLEEVAIPSRRIDPGTYALGDSQGIVLTVEVDRAMTSAELADTIGERKGNV